MTLMAAARTSAQSAAFETVSIVPSISMAWTTLPDDDHRREGHVNDAPRSRSQSQPPAECRQERDGEDRPHGDHAEGGERRRRCEGQRVDHVRRAGDPEARDVDHHRQTSAPPIQ